MPEPKKEKEKKKKKGSLTKIIIIILIFFVILGGSFAVYTIFFSKKMASSAASKTLVFTPVTSAKTYSIDQCLVNLTDAGGQNYLQVTIFLGYESGKLDAELADKKPIIRDVVIGILRSKSTADFNGNKADKIKAEILDKVNPLLTKGQLDNVYFDDILVQ